MSLKGDKYETTEEVKFRLEGTVVKYEDRLVYITNVNVPDREEDGKKEVARVFFKELPLAPNAPNVRKFLSSRNFDLTPFPMGYINHQGEAVFVSRAPVRQNKQGLSRGNTQFTFPDAKNRVDNKRRNIDFEDLITSQAFVDMYNNKYPSFQEAGKMLDGKNCKSVAIGRKFVLSIDDELELLLLYHEGVKCAVAFKGDKALRLPPRFKFLKEEVAKLGVPVNG